MTVGQVDAMSHSARAFLLPWLRRLLVTIALSCAAWGALLLLARTAQAAEDPAPPVATADLLAHPEATVAAAAAPSSAGEDSPADLPDATPPEPAQPPASAQPDADPTIGAGSGASAGSGVAEASSELPSAVAQTASTPPVDASVDDPVGAAPAGPLPAVEPPAAPHPTPQAGGEKPSPADAFPSDSPAVVTAAVDGSAVATPAVDGSAVATPAVDGSAVATPAADASAADASGVDSAVVDTPAASGTASTADPPAGAGVASDPASDDPTPAILYAAALPSADQVVVGALAAKSVAVAAHARDCRPAGVALGRPPVRTVPLAPDPPSVAPAAAVGFTRVPLGLPTHEVPLPPLPLPAPAPVPTGTNASAANSGSGGVHNTAAGGLLAVMPAGFAVPFADDDQGRQGVDTRGAVVARAGEPAVRPD